MAQLGITRVKFIDNSVQVEKIESDRLNAGLHRMASSVLNLAQMYAPVDTGALQDDGRINVGHNNAVISFGGFAVPYARRRHYENKKNPQTLLYLERAGDAVAEKGLVKYL